MWLPAMLGATDWPQAGNTSGCPAIQGEPCDLQNFMVFWSSAGPCAPLRTVSVLLQPTRQTQEIHMTKFAVALIASMFAFGAYAADAASAPAAAKPAAEAASKPAKKAKVAKEHKAHAAKAGASAASK